MTDFPPISQQLVQGRSTERIRQQMVFTTKTVGRELGQESSSSLMKFSILGDEKRHDHRPKSCSGLRSRSTSSMWANMRKSGGISKERKDRGDSKDWAHQEFNYGRA